MKKDIIIAVGVGFILGGIAAVTIINLPFLLKKIFPEKKPLLVENITPTIPQLSPLKLEIDSPESGELLTEKKIRVSGSSDVGNQIVIASNLEATVVEASTNGRFATETTIGEGASEIHFTAKNDKGETQTKTITVFYTEEKL